MKNLLGYLNQSEWIYSLNIGNIMQIAPLTLQDFMSSSSLQMELSREFVLEKVIYLYNNTYSSAFLQYLTSAWALNTDSCTNSKKCWVSISTQEETRNLILLIIPREYWHGKAVEIAISFLPSESPLVSHILMSYEKHHSPSKQAIVTYNVIFLQPEDDHQDV